MKRFRPGILAALALGAAVLTFSAAAADAMLPGRPCDWNRSERLGTGVRHLLFQMTSPRPVRINVLRIDLRTPKLKLVTGSGDPDRGQPMPDYPGGVIITRRQTTRNFVRDAERKHRIRMVAAVNASPWSPWCKPFNHRYAGRLGLMISGGEVISAPERPIPAFVVDRGGRPDIVTVRPDDNFRRWDLALTGFEIILERGRNIATPSRRPEPRMVFGLDAGRRYLYLLAADGRQPERSEGLTTAECAEWLRYCGATDAINMDGGGSTTMLVRHPSGRLERLNRHPGDSKYDRPVANSLGVGLPR